MQQQEEEYRISVLLCYTYRITAEDAQEVCFVAASNRHQVTNERPEDHVISCTVACTYMCCLSRCHHESLVLPKQIERSSL